MSDTGDLIESLEADVARLKAELARVKEGEAERVKRAFVRGYDCGFLDHIHGECRAPDVEAGRRLAEGTL